DEPDRALSATIGHEGDRLPIRRERRPLVLGLTRRQRTYVGAIDICRPEMTCAGAGRAEHHARTGRYHMRIEIATEPIGQGSDLAGLRSSRFDTHQRLMVFV